MQPHHCWAEEISNFTRSTGHIAPSATGRQSAAFAMRAQRWLIFGVSSAPSPFLQGAHSRSVPMWCCCMGLSHPRCRTLPFSLLIQRIFLLIQFSSFSRSLWVEALTFSMSTTLPNLVSPLHLQRMYSDSSSRLSMKILNNIGLTIDPSCALLVTSHQLDGKPLITPFQPGSLSLSCPAIQYNPASFLHSWFFFIFRKEKVQNPHGKGKKSPKKFLREVGRDRKQSPKSCLSTCNKKSKEWTPFFFQGACNHKFYYFLIDTRDIFQGSIYFISTADQNVINTKHCKKTCSVTVVFLTEYLGKWVSQRGMP